jgi:uncharacterized protein with FMN-binding domain
LEEEDLKKLITLLCALIMLLSMGACSTPGSETVQPVKKAELKFTPGTYTSEQMGHNGPLTVQVTCTEDAITEVCVPSHSETRRIGDAAIDAVATTVVEHQTLKVDAVSGSTVTRAAVLSGVTDCIAQAGVDPSDLQDYVAPVMDDEEISTQIVVVGAGGAGMSAAVEAAQLGADVVVLEKLASIGGSTGHSSGVILYADEGFTVEDYVALHVARAKSDEAIARRIAIDSAANVEWLGSMGWVWYPRPQMVDDTWNAARANPDQDGKSVRPNGMSIIDVLESAAAKTGKVSIRLNTRATELIVKDGVVVGVVAVRPDGSKLTVHADAVILATGGFDNGEMAKKLQPAIYNAKHVSAVGNVGDGIAMIEAVGGVSLYTAPALGQGNTNWMNTLNLPENFLEVNGDGDRFVAEDAHYMVEMNAMLASSNPNFAYLFDSNNDVTVLEELVAKGTVVKADTIEELAEKMNINVDGLKATVARYNELTGKEDVDFGKATELMLGFSQAPFYGVKAYAEILLSFGGPVVNEECEFLTADGSVIPGVYGAGELVNSKLFVEGYSYGGGAIQHAIATGRIAAQNAFENYVN